MKSGPPSISPGPETYQHDKAGGGTAGYFLLLLITVGGGGGLF